MMTVKMTCSDNEDDYDNDDNNGNDQRHYAEVVKIAGCQKEICYQRTLDVTCEKCTERNTCH